MGFPLRNFAPFAPSAFKAFALRVNDPRHTSPGRSEAQAWVTDATTTQGLKEDAEKVCFR
jgi:hypothetical protein